MPRIKQTTLMLSAAMLMTVSSQNIFAQDEFNYSINLQSNGDMTVRNAKGQALKGVVDDRPIKRIRSVKTLTIIEAEGSHFIIINGRRYYLPH